MRSCALDRACGGGDTGNSRTIRCVGSTDTGHSRTTRCVAPRLVGNSRTRAWGVRHPECDSGTGVCVPGAVPWFNSGTRMCEGRLRSRNSGSTGTKGWVSVHAVGNTGTRVGGCRPGGDSGNSRTTGSGSGQLVLDSRTGVCDPDAVSWFNSGTRVCGRCCTLRVDSGTRVWRSRPGGDSGNSRTSGCGSRPLVLDSGTGVCDFDAVPGYNSGTRVWGVWCRRDRLTRRDSISTGNTGGER